MWMRARLKKDRKKPGMRGRNGRETTERKKGMKRGRSREKLREEVFTYCYCMLTQPARLLEPKIGDTSVVGFCVCRMVRLTVC
jgi:hypothetical protein